MDQTYAYIRCGDETARTTLLILLLPRGGAKGWKAFGTPSGSSNEFPGQGPPSRRLFQDGEARATACASGQKNIPEKRKRK